MEGLCRLGLVRQTRVSPERDYPDPEPDGIEMSEFVPLCKVNIHQLRYLPFYDMRGNASLESIQRLKKIYDLLVNENIIHFLIGD